MKHLLLTLTLIAFSANSFADGRGSAVLIDSGQNDYSLGKGDKIKEATNKDIAIIKSQSNNWQGAMDSSLNKLSDSSTSLQKVIDDITVKQGEVRPDEEDNNVPDYAKVSLKKCSGITPRIAYKNGSWTCIAALKCSDLSSNQKYWIEDPDTGKCKRPATKWHTSNFGNCGSGSQSRSVMCKTESGDSVLPESDCSLPKPATSREC